MSTFSAYEPLDSDKRSPELAGVNMRLEAGAIRCVLGSVPALVFAISHSIVPV